MSDRPGDVGTQPMEPGRPPPSRSGASDESEKAPPLQSPACVRCRAQKLKCSKERPSCRRCLSMDKPCSYPAPLDRKMLAAKRRNYPREPMGRDGQEGGRSSVPRQHDVMAPEATYKLSVGVVKDPVIGTVPEPGSEAAMFLVEVYFSRAYHAPLLFHKPRFLLQWARQTVPEFIYLSIFALASVFLHSKDDQSASNVPGFLSASNFSWGEAGQGWATLASQKVLAQADVPCLETVQACQNLVLYWFACGQTDRANFHAHVAYRTCRMLGFHNRNDEEDDDPVQEELQRRCYWSAWMSQCVSQGNAPFARGSWGEVAGVRLPSDDASFHDGRPLGGAYVDLNGHLNRPPAGDLPPSYFAELAKLFGLWWESERCARGLIEHDPSKHTPDWASFFSVARRLEQFGDQLPRELCFSSIQVADAKSDCENIFALNCLYHTSIASMHASVVPLFSDSKLASSLSKSMIQSSANEALSHSAATLDMASRFLHFAPDVSKVPSVTGFCMFVCVSIQHKYLASLQRSPPLDDRLKAAISILNILKGYWTPLQLLAATLGKQLSPGREASFPGSMSGAPGSDRSRPDHEPVDDSPNVFTFVEPEDSKNAVQRRSTYKDVSHNGSTTSFSPIADAIANQNGATVSQPPDATAAR